MTYARPPLAIAMRSSGSINCMWAACMVRCTGSPAYDHARAEDLTQEAFIRAWQKLPSFRFESAFGTWLYRLAVNVALMDIRARGADPVSMVDDEHLPDTGETPFCAAERRELEHAIGRCRRAPARCWCCTTLKAGDTTKSAANWAWRSAHRKLNCIAPAVAAQGFGRKA
jgi:hypothetical protein